MQFVLLGTHRPAHGVVDNAHRVDREALLHNTLARSQRYAEQRSTSRVGATGIV